MINNYKNRFVISKIELNDRYKDIRYKASTIFFITKIYRVENNFAHIKFRTTDFVDGAFDIQLVKSDRLEEVFDFIDDPNDTCESKCCCEKTQEKIDSIDRKLEILLNEISSLKNSSRSLVEETEENIRKDYIRRHNGDTSDSEYDREYIKWQLKNDPDMMAPWLYDDEGYLK